MVASDELPSTSAAGKSNTSQFVGFQLADQEYLFRIEQIQEVVILKQVTKTPQVPRYVEGVANLAAGRLFRSINLRNLFGLEPKPADTETRTIVVNVARAEHGLHSRYGFAGHADTGRKHPTRARDNYGERGDAVAGFARLNGRLMIVLDINELLEPGKLDQINTAALQDLRTRIRCGNGHQSGLIAGATAGIGTL